jgi:hypothetical protein
LAPAPPDQREYQIALARFAADLQKLRPKAHAYAVVGGVEFGHQLDDILRPLGSLHGAIAGLLEKPTPELRQARLRDILRDLEPSVIQKIDQIPIEWEARLLEEGTPFSAYTHIHDAIRVAKKRVHFIDRYLDVSVYDLYVRDIDRAIEVRLVSTKGNSNSGTRALAAAARLAAGEFRDFQLVECTPEAMHDRNLRVDDQIFFLGPSLKDVGRYLTNFAPAASSTDANRVLDDLIASGQRVV